MTEYSQGVQNASSGTARAVSPGKTWRSAKTLGCCVVVAAAMVALTANATMSTKKDSAPTKAGAPAAKGDAVKKKEAVKGAGSAAEQESKLAPKDSAKKGAK